MVKPMLPTEQKGTVCCVCVCVSHITESLCSNLLRSQLPSYHPTQAHPKTSCIDQFFQAPAYVQSLGVKARSKGCLFQMQSWPSSRLRQATPHPSHVSDLHRLKMNPWRLTFCLGCGHVHLGNQKTFQKTFQKIRKFRASNACPSQQTQSSSRSGSMPLSACFRAKRSCRPEQSSCLQDCMHELVLAMFAV